MKYCAHCGTELLDEAVICPACGCPAQENQVQNAEDNSVGLGTASIVSGIFIPLAGFICGGIGLSRAKKFSNETGKKRCTIGLVVSAVAWVVSMVINMLYMSDLLALLGY